jgi:hypothetical protein
MVSDDDRTAVAPLDTGKDADEDCTVVAGAELEDDLTMVVGGDSEAGAEDLTMVRPRPPERPRLVTRDPSGALQELPLSKPDVLIGRGAGCDVALTNPEVSRQHVRIVTRGSDRVLVTVGTRGNTYVNGQAVTGEQVLRHGDILLLASEQLVYATLDDTPPFSATGAPGAPAAPTPGIAGPETASVAAPTAAPRSSAGAVGIGLALAGIAAVGLYVMLQEPETPAPAAVVATLPLAPPAAAPPAPMPRAPEPLPAPAPPAVAAVAPAPQPDPAEAKAEQVRKLLYRADVAYLEKRYLTPPDDSAVYLYAEALKIEPDNARARDKIAAIVDQYVRWAEEALGRRDRTRAAQMVDKASYVMQEASAAAETPDVRRRLDAVKNGLAGRRTELP